MTHTKSGQDEIQSTMTSEDTTITVPEHVVDAIAARVSVLDDADEDTVRDIAFDHVEVTHRLVTPAGVPIEKAALERAGVDVPVDVPLEDDVVEAVETAADRAGEDPLEWIRGAARDRLETDADTDDVEVTYDEDETEDAPGSSDEVAEPIDAEASAQLDYATDPERPLSIDVEIPAGVIGDDELDDVLETVSINARIVDE